jgi:hypothetical protein
MARRKAAFLVSVWFDPSTREQVRGSVVYLPSQERHEFADMTDLVAFLQIYAERARVRIPPERRGNVAGTG